MDSKDNSNQESRRLDSKMKVEDSKMKVKDLNESNEDSAQIAFDKNRN